MRTIAPAKINWTLEVLGRRDDGYHEIRSVMQTIDLFDEVSAERTSKPSYEAMDGTPLVEDDLVVRAAAAFEERVGRRLPVTVRLEKRIPVASGLGGGSSDAAAVLRLVNEVYSLGLTSEDLAAVGARVGSDVPFFVHGGTALVEGGGEQVRPLPDAAERWRLVGVPAVSVPDKTGRMYESLKSEDFTDGRWANRAIVKLRTRAGPTTADRYNVFQVRAYVMFQEPLMKLGEALLYAGAKTFDVAGSGPAIWASVDSRDEAESLIRKIRAFVIGDFRGAEANLMIARTLPAAEATAIVE